MPTISSKTRQPDDNDTTPASPAVTRMHARPSVPVGGGRLDPSARRIAQVLVTLLTVAIAALTSMVSIASPASALTVSVSGNAGVLHFADSSPARTTAPRQRRRLRRIHPHDRRDRQHGLSLARIRRTADRHHRLPTVGATEWNLGQIRRHPASPGRHPHRILGCQPFRDQHERSRRLHFSVDARVTWWRTDTMQRIGSASIAYNGNDYVCRTTGLRCATGTGWVWTN